MAEKNCFTLYKDYTKHFHMLTDEEAGKLIKAIFEYENGIEPEGLEGMVAMAFSFISAQLDRDDEKYAEKCQKNRENGSKGGRPRQSAAIDNIADSIKTADDAYKKHPVLPENKEERTVLGREEKNPTVLEQEEKKPTVLEQEEKNPTVLEKTDTFSDKPKKPHTDTDTDTDTDTPKIPTTTDHSTTQSDSFSEKKADRERINDNENRGCGGKKQNAAQRVRGEPVEVYYDDPDLNKAFEDFVAMRKKIRKPLATDRAVRMAQKKLETLASSSGVFSVSTAIEILNQSVMGSWTGLYPLKQNNGYIAQGRGSPIDWSSV